ncbi:MAG: efflux RND transporter permease subunit [Nevskiaceae bacterium]
MEARLAAWVVRWRVALFAACVVALLAAVAGARLLWFESSYRIFFKDDNPQLLAHDAIEAAYTKADNVAFIVAPADGRVFTRETLAVVKELTEIGWTVPRSIRVDSITNFQWSRAVGDDLRVQDLVQDPAALSDAELAQLQAVALGEPALVDGLISRRAHVTSVNVRLEMPADSRAQGEANREVMAFVRGVVARVTQEHPQLTIHLMGQVVVNYGFNEIAERDAATMVPLMFAVVVVLLAVFLRSVSATVVTTLIIVASVLFTVGALGWLGFQVNQVNVSAPVIILTLAVSDCVHVLVHYLNDLRRGLASEAAMTHALEVNLVPVFLTSFTTMIGFFSLNTSETPPIRELGTVVGIGVMGAMLITLTVLPALMLWLPKRFAPPVDSRGFTLGPLAEVILRRPRAYFAAVTVVALGLMAFIPRNDLNDDTVDYFDKSLPLRQAFDFVQQNLTGIDTIAYSLPAEGAGGIYDPAYLRRVEAFAEWWKRQPEVTHVSTFVDVIRRLNRNLHGDDAAYDRIPDERETVAQYVLLYELSLPQGLDLNDALTFDKSATRLSVNIKDTRAKEMLQIEERAQRWLADNAPQMRSYGSSLSIMFAHLGQENIYGMMKGSALALLLISATLVVFLRSWKFGLLSLLPNAFPAAIAFGIWGLTSGQVNLAVAAVFSITLGIVVDNTIHFFSKYLYARRQLRNGPEDAIRYAFTTVGAALLVTTAVLTLGFLVLAQSDFALNASMGTMTAMVVVIALMFDLLFLPALLLWADPERKKEADSA